MASEKRVTIMDIARMAGVSAGAVSLALNDRPGVSEATRKRILDIVAELDWRPSSVARALVGAKAGVIGMVVNRPAKTLGTEAFFTDLISGIQSGLAESNASLQMRLSSDLDEEIRTYRRWKNSRQVDGVIVLDPRDDDPRMAALKDIGLPAILIGSGPSAEGEPSSVWIDDIEAASSLFGYLAALGHRRIAYVAGPADYEHTTKRIAVLRQLAADSAADDVPLVVDAIETDFTPATSARVTRDLLMLKDRPTAIVYDNDVMAVSGLRVAQEMGITAPHDLSLASFDDSVIAELVTPSLTCLTRDTFAVGERAALHLLAQLDSADPLPSVACSTPALTVRESTAPPARG